MEEYIQVSTTFETKEDARKLAKTLVEKRLAACIQILGPVTSIYGWDNRVNEEEEWLLLIKTRNSHYERLEKAIKELHTYEVPEIIATPITEGSNDYLNWMDQVLG